MVVGLCADIAINGIDIIVNIFDHRNWKVFEWFDGETAEQLRQQRYRSLAAEGLRELQVFAHQIR